MLPSFPKLDCGAVPVPEPVAGCYDSLTTAENEPVDQVTAAFVAHLLGEKEYSALAWCHMHGNLRPKQWVHEWEDAPGRFGKRAFQTFSTSDPILQARTLVAEEALHLLLSAIAVRNQGIVAKSAVLKIIELAAKAHALFTLLIDRWMQTDMRKEQGKKPWHVCETVAW
jgi:hypothetical protein